MILIVEDDRVVSETLTLYLQQAGYVVDAVADGVTGLARARNPDVRLVILDLMLPGLNGREVCRQLRATSRVPILMLTARSSEDDRVAGFDLGADDYVAKPFSPREVVARIKAILRRVQRSANSEPAVPGLVIDEAQYRATFNGQVLDLTPVEFRLLRTLADAPGRVFSREQLLDNLYTDHRVVTDRTVDSHIKNLRRKLDHARPEQELIRSIYGVGYKLEG